MPIPRMFSDDDDYYFVRRTKTAVPQSHVFDTPQAAALAAIELNDKNARDLKITNERLRDWHDGLESARQAKEAAA